MSSTMTKIIASLMLTAALSAQTSIVAVPTSPTVNETVVLISHGTQALPAAWTASGGQWCLTRACEWVAPTLTIPAHDGPAYWRSTTAGTFTITWAQDDDTVTLTITVSAAE